MKISVVIPCLNEQNYVGKLLSDLAKQTYRDFEVIVSDSASDDDTINAALKYKDRLDLKIARNTKRGLALGRNSGARQASGEYILFLDADVRLPAGLLAAMKDAGKQGYTMVTARFRADCNNLFDRMMIWIWSHYLRVHSTLKKPAITGGCAFIKRQLHEKIGGYNEKILYSEDMDYSFRLVRAGGKYKCLKTPLLKVSCRRFEKDGRLRMIWRSLYSEIYRFFHRGELKPGMVEYKFGHYDKK